MRCTLVSMSAQVNLGRLAMSLQTFLNGVLAHPFFSQDPYLRAFLGFEILLRRCWLLAHAHMQARLDHAYSRISKGDLCT
jgi:hypothetical protein